MIVTGVPTGPLAGVKLRICGVTRKLVILVSFPVGVVTLTVPVVPPLGTLAVKIPSQAAVVTGSRLTRSPRKYFLRYQSFSRNLQPSFTCEYKDRSSAVIGSLGLSDLRHQEAILVGENGAKIFLADGANRNSSH